MKTDFSTLLEKSHGASNTKILTLPWREGVQFRVIQRRYWINLAEVTKWIESSKRHAA